MKFIFWFGTAWVLGLLLIGSLQQIDQDLKSNTLAIWATQR
jgi:hypothetical protein